MAESALLPLRRTKCLLGESRAQEQDYRRRAAAQISVGRRGHQEAQRCYAVNEPTVLGMWEVGGELIIRVVPDTRAYGAAGHTALSATDARPTGVPRHALGVRPFLAWSAAKLAVLARRFSPALSPRPV